MGSLSFMVFGRAATLVEPAKGALNDPAALEHDKTFGGGIAFDYFQTQAPAWQVRGDPVPELLGMVGAISPDHAYFCPGRVEGVWPRKAGRHRDPAHWRQSQ